MKVTFYNAEFDIPDLMIEKFVKDFDGLPGGGKYHEVTMLRDSVNHVLDLVAQDPEMLYEPEYLSDFIQAMAMKHALERHGIYYDA
jgi:hypothetical protein